jgi:fructose-bisphosphate aldolase, class I
MRSVIKQASESGIAAVVAQQFEIARRIIAAGLVPIVEPEVDIHCPDKARAEAMLKAEIMRELNALGDDQRVMLKLTLPEQDNFYADLIEHPAHVTRGGAVRRLQPRRGQRAPGQAERHGGELLPRPDRGVVEAADDEEFNATLDKSIQSIYEASIT